MKNVNVCLLAAIACTYSLQATAGYLNKTPNFILNDKLIPLELKPLPIPNQAVKLAAVCAVTGVGCVNAGFDNNNNIDMNLDPNKQCDDDGYKKTSCPSNQVSVDYCPFNNTYFKSCACPSQYQYSATECSRYLNSSLGNDRCTQSDGKVYATSCVCNTAIYRYTPYTCKAKLEMSGTFCTDMGNNNYSTDCNCIGGDSKYKYTKELCVEEHKSGSENFANWDIDSSDVCKNKSSSCSCAPTSGACPGYSYDTNTCTGEYMVGEQCNNGCQLKWRCKDLCPNKGTLTYCPTGYVCTYEECSKKYYKTGCAINYKYWCKTPEMNCMTLGYNKSSCLNGGIKCPYDISKMACQ